MANELLGGMDSRPRIHIHQPLSVAERKSTEVVWTNGVRGMARRSANIQRAVHEALESIDAAPAVIIWEGVR